MSVNGISILSQVLQHLWLISTSGTGKVLAEKVVVAAMIEREGRGRMHWKRLIYLTVVPRCTLVYVITILFKGPCINRMAFTSTRLWASARSTDFIWLLDCWKIKDPCRQPISARVCKLARTIIRREWHYFQGMSDPIAIKAKASENLIFAVNNLNDTDKSSISYSKQEFITKCSFNGRQCSVETCVSIFLLI